MVELSQYSDDMLFKKIKGDIVREEIRKYLMIELGLALFMLCCAFFCSLDVILTFTLFACGVSSIPMLFVAFGKYKVSQIWVSKMKIYSGDDSKSYKVKDLEDGWLTVVDKDVYEKMSVNSSYKVLMRGKKIIDLYEDLRVKYENSKGLKK